MKLEIEPIPQSSWGISLANKLGEKEWDKIRKDVYKKAKCTCIICGEGGEMNCHEVWQFDYRKKIQRLVGFECLCKLCHDVKHFGRSLGVNPKTYVEKLVKHWCKVNNRTVQAFYNYQKEVFEENKRRAKIYWVVKAGRYTLV